MIRYYEIIYFYAIISPTASNFMPSEKRIDNIPSVEVLTSWQQRRAKEIQTRLSWLIHERKISQKNLKGRVIDLGTGSGAGLVALRALGATQAVGVEDGRELRRAMGQINKIDVNPFEAFSPSEAICQQEKIFNISNEQFLKIIKEESWGISLITCFWISYQPPIRQIEEVLNPEGQVVITATEDCYSYLKEIPRKTKLETEIIEIPGNIADGPKNDCFVLIGTKIT